MKMENVPKMDKKICLFRVKFRLCSNKMQVAKNLNMVYAGM